MLYDDDSIAIVYESMKDGQEFIYIVKMQSGCGFIKDIKRLTRSAFREFP